MNLKIAKEECANWVAGNCVMTGECFIDKKRCEYLERCVLPLKKYINNPNWQHWSKLIDQYIDYHKNGR